MQFGLIGLGRMGMNMARRWLRGHHAVVAYNRSPDKVEQIKAEGADGAASVHELVERLSAPRVVWMMLPAGAAVEAHVEALSQILSPGDIMIDGGNTYYRDDLRRAKMLAAKGIGFMDVGVSGGIWGLKNGYCSMAGGARSDFDHIRPLFETLAPKDGYMYCGPAGSGHFVKMIHNGIEYAMMQAYGEGFEILKSSPYAGDIDLHEIARLWNKGSVVRSWLLELLESALEKHPGLEGIKGFVQDSGEGRWTVQQALDSGVPATSIAHAIFERFRSRETESFADKVLAALRNEFGGHEIKTE